MEAQAQKKVLVIQVETSIRPNTMLMLNLIPIGVFAIEAALGRSFAAIEIAGAAGVIGALGANNLYLRGGSRRR